MRRLRMDMIRWDRDVEAPFREFESLQDEINRLFDLTRSPTSRGLFERTFSPALDVVENSDSYGVMCDLPGVDIKDLEISVADNVLTIKGEKKELLCGGSDVYSEQMSSGKFQRTVSLPLSVQADKVEAVLKDGVLKLILPKSEELKPKQITVKAT